MCTQFHTIILHSTVYTEYLYTIPTGNYLHAVVVLWQAACEEDFECRLYMIVGGLAPGVHAPSRLHADVLMWQAVCKDYLECRLYMIVGGLATGVHVIPLWCSRQSVKMILNVVFI